METRVKWNALFNKGAHPRPSLFEKSSVHLNISNTIGENQRNQNKKRGPGENLQTHREYKQKQNKTNNTKHFQTYVAQTGHRSKSCVFVACGPCPFEA